MDRKLTLSQMAEHLGVTPKTFSKYVREYSIPFIKLGKSKRFDIKTVEAALTCVETPEILQPSNILYLPSYKQSKYAAKLGLA